jgi:hypothetical protein
MKWYSKAEEHEKYSPTTEPQTVKICGRVVGVSIERWLASGLDVPEWWATDGVSEMESAQFME